MSWLKKIFSGEQNTGDDSSVNYQDLNYRQSGEVIEILNSYGHFDSSPLVVEDSPKLEAIFNDPNPPVIQKLSENNRSYWSNASVAERRMTALIGYLQHPNPQIRVATMAFIPQNQSGRVAQVLVDRLGGDPDSSVRTAAARTIWECERKVNCEYAVNKLKSEIQYGNEMSVVGPTRAKRAFQLLIENAPDQQAKESIKMLKL